MTFGCDCRGTRADHPELTHQVVASKTLHIGRRCVLPPNWKVDLTACPSACETYSFASESNIRSQRTVGRISVCVGVSAHVSVFSLKPPQSFWLTWIVRSVRGVESASTN